MRKSKAFTLIEMLVVIAIISILLALLVPTLGSVMAHMQRTQCGGGMFKLAVAYNQYAAEHGGRIPSANPGADGWVGDGNTVAAVKDGALYPYVGEMAAYKCSNPAYDDYYISYAVSGWMNGQEGGPTVISNIADPKKTLLMVEEDDYRGWNQGSWLISPPDTWDDYVAVSHDGGDNLTFADGHIEYWEWIDPDTLTLPPGQHHASDPGSLDLARLAEVYKDPR